MTTTATADSFIDDYWDWLRKETTSQKIGEWTCITLPLLDASNDDIALYAKVSGDSIAFSDDGYTLASLQMSGVKLTESRRNRIKRITQKYGAYIDETGCVALESDGNRGDALNRFAQTLVALSSVQETAQRHVSEYFADDVAEVLDSCHVYYTANVGIRGLSNYSHTFDFLFQKNANKPTRFCQAPNSFGKDTVRNIMWSWDDTRRATTRSDAKLIVIGNDRDKPLQTTAVEAFENYGVTVIPWSQLKERAPQELAA